MKNAAKTVLALGLVGTTLAISNNTLPQSNNTFAFRVFAQATRTDPQKNVFISPYSISSALMMLANGVTPTKQPQVLRALGVRGQTQDAINAQNLELRQLLVRNGEGFRFDVANAIWTAQGFPVKNAFVTQSQKYFDAKVQTADFTNPNTVRDINTWASDNTNGKINKIIERIEPNDVVYLFNAVYFNSNWQSPFATEDTQTKPFTLSDGTRKDVPMMMQTKRFEYLETATFQAVRLPYKGESSMVVFLPKENQTLAAWLKTFNDKNWQTWRNQMTGKKVALQLPRFKAQYSLDLNKPLQSLGLGVLYQKGNLSGLSDDNRTVVSKAWHQSIIDVNERGTEAAAVTGIGVTTTSIEIDEPTAFVANRPFVYLIQDNRTRSILFMGTMHNP